MSRFSEGPWDAAAIKRMRNILERVRTGKSLTKLQEEDLEDHDMDYTELEASLTIGLNREFTFDEEQKIVDACIEAVRKLGYHEVQMHGDQYSAGGII